MCSFRLTSSCSHSPFFLPPFLFSHSVFKDGQWSVGSVLDSFNIPLLYERILKERRKELIEVADKEKELQLDSLHHDLQMTALQEALLETQSQSGTYTCTLMLLQIIND